MNGIFNIFLEELFISDPVWFFSIHVSMYESLLSLYSHVKLKIFRSYIKGVILISINSCNSRKIDHVSNAHIVCLGLNRHGCAKIIAQFNSSTLPFHVKVKVSIIKNWPRVKLKVNLPKHLPACSIAMVRCYNKWSLFSAIQ